MAIGTVATDVAALTRFSAFLTQARPRWTALAGLDRAVLERYLAWLATSGLGHGAKEDAVTGVGMFFQAIRQHGWDASLPATAAFFTGDLPHRPASGQPAPRRARHDPGRGPREPGPVANPAGTAGHPHPHPVRPARHRRVRAGLRLPGPRRAGAPYLRYFNHKMRREAAVPIDPDLETQIRGQQQHVAAALARAAPAPVPAARPATSAGTAR